MSTATVPARSAVSTRRWLTPGRRWAIFAGAAIGWSAVRAGLGGDIVNTAGFPSLWKFISAVVNPVTSIEFLQLTASSALTTLCFAILGTALSVCLGLLFAPLLSERLWELDAPKSSFGRVARRGLWGATKLGALVPRSLHEVLWALVLVQIYGFSPVVAVISIGVPFGAVTATVFAETIDEVDPAPYVALRSMGAGRLRSLTWGLMPEIGGELTSYVFYRFECAIRSAAILGIVGVGGLGFQLDASFESLKYGQMWTLIAALMVLSGLADALSSVIRRRRGGASARCGDVALPPPLGVVDTADEQSLSTSDLRRSSDPVSGEPAPEAPGVRRGRDPVLIAAVIAMFLAVPLSWWFTELDVSILWNDRRLALASKVGGELFPPHLGPTGWSGIIGASLDTVAMSLLAISLAAVAALALGAMAARRGEVVQRSTRLARLGSTAWSVVVRTSMLLARAVPPPVWAFLATLVLFPGIWPGVAALALYNAGVLGRLYAETLEEADPRPREAIEVTGAGRMESLLYGSMPVGASRLISLGLYRWEVTVRETIAVGVVGAAGLGRLIDSDLAARDFAVVTAAAIAFVVLTLAGSWVNIRARRAFR